MNIDVTSFVKTPYTLVSISWEADGHGGSTECEAWRGQHEIEKLEAAGYTITGVGAA